MSTRAKLLLLITISLIIAAPLVIAQEETPSVIEQLALTATAIIEVRTTTPTPAPEEPTPEPTEAMTETVEATEAAATETPTEEATPEPTEEASPEASGEAPSDGEMEVRGTTLLFLLIGAFAVLTVGAVVFLRENPRPMGEEDEE